MYKLNYNNYKNIVVLTPTIEEFEKACNFLIKYDSSLKRAIKNDEFSWDDFSENTIIDIAKVYEYADKIHYDWVQLDDINSYNDSEDYITNNKFITVDELIYNKGYQIPYQIKDIIKNLDLLAKKL